MEKNGNQRPEPGIRKIKMNFDAPGETRNDHVRGPGNRKNTGAPRPEIRRVNVSNPPTIHPKHSIRKSEMKTPQKPTRANLAKTGSVVIPPEFFLDDENPAMTEYGSAKAASKGAETPEGARVATPVAATTRRAKHANGNGGTGGGNGNGNGKGKSGKKDDDDKKGGFFKRHSKALIILLDIIIVVSLLLAAYFYFEPRLRSNQQLKQENKAKEIFDEAIEQTEGELIVKIDPKEKAKPVPGEGYEDFGHGYAIPEPEYDADGNPLLRYIGRLHIESVEIDTLIAADHSNFSLRYSAGHATDSAQIGTPGQAVIYGHNFFDRTRVFSRLNEVKVGDRFYIDLLAGNRRLNYKVTRAEKIPAAELEARVFEKTNENRVLLVTCSTEYQNGIPLNRILVYGELIGTEPIPMKDLKQIQ